MSHSMQFMIVDKRLLPQLPKGFQDYVKKYFFSQMINRVPCLVAFIITTIDEDSYTRIKRGMERGNAPGRTHELDIFDPYLFRWIKEHANTMPGLYLFDHDWTAVSSDE